MTNRNLLEETKFNNIPLRKIQIDTNEFILYAPDSLKYITDNMFNILNTSILFYKTLFGIDNFRKIQINYFDDLEKFREYIYSLREERKSLPEYATGTFDKGMINAFIKPNLVVGSFLYNKALYLASHELFHIMYQELIWELKNLKRIVWFDEGMAQLFSGENNDLLNEDKFINWVKSLIDTTKVIPNLNELTHGLNFVNEEYNGYKLSLLAVKYLFDILDFEEFKKLMHDQHRIEEYGLNILNEAFMFYKNKIKIR